MHLYADDTQIYIGINSLENITTSTRLDNITSCLKDLKVWMSTNFLKLNRKETNVLFIGKQSVLDKFLVTFLLYIKLNLLLVKHNNL